MAASKSSAEFVHDWAAKAARDLDVKTYAVYMGSALNAIWRRSLVTLGEVTLMAIARRVVLGGRGTFSWYADVHVDASGFRLSGIRTEDLSEAAFKDGLLYLVSQFLTVLDTLTADTLTHHLRDELLRLPTPLGARKNLGKAASGKGKKGKRNEE